MLFADRPVHRVSNLNRAGLIAAALAEHAFGDDWTGDALAGGGRVYVADLDGKTIVLSHDDEMITCRCRSG